MNNTLTHNNTLDKNTFVVWGKWQPTHAITNPYGKALNMYEEWLSWYKKEAEENWLPFNDPQNADGNYYLAIRKAIDEANTGTNYTEIMRMISGLTGINQHNQENMLYDHIPTPFEGKKIFMEMGAKQFPSIKRLDVHSLTDFIAKEDMKVMPLQNQDFTNLMKVSNIDEKSKLDVLNHRLYEFSIWGKNPIRKVNTTKWDDVKFLYAMMCLKEKLEQTVWEKGKNEQIDDLKKKL